MRAAAEKADDTGWAGECFVNAYFSALKKADRVRSFEWISSDNAIAPYDFHVNFDSNASSFVEVKSTAGDFNRPIHISASELTAMRDNRSPHDIYRVFEIEESVAKLRIAERVNNFAHDVLTVFAKLPDGVTPDSVSVDPSILTFGSPIELQLPDEPEDE